MGRQDYARWQDDGSGWDEEPQGRDRPRPVPDASEADTTTRNLIDAVAENEAIRSGEIDIVVRDGEVALTGTVADRATRKQAEVCVASVTGVRDVTNQLRIEFSPEIQDEERRA